MAIKTQILMYTDFRGITHKSNLCLPENADNLPGVLVAPEWWGLTNTAKQAAEKLAETGYVALAMDVYGEGKVASDAATANAWMMSVVTDKEVLLKLTQEALTQLANVPEVDAKRLAAIGFCFGGKVVLDVARIGANLKCVASFHGNLTPAKPATEGSVKAKLLVEHGAADTMVPLASVEAFKKEMDAAGADYQLDVFPNAKHGFTNPESDENARKNGIDVGYNQAAAEKSWANMLKLFAENL